MKTYLIMYTIIVAIVYTAGWIAAVVVHVPNSDLNKQSSHCSVAEYSYPVIPGLDISWLSYCQQVYGDVMLETSLDDHSSIIDDAFIMHDSDPLLTHTKKASTTDVVVVPSGSETNITTNSADDSRRSSSISYMSDYLLLARIAQLTKQHVNLFYENTSVKILPLDWTYDSKINNIIISDTKRWVVGNQKHHYRSIVILYCATLHKHTLQPI